ncbi:MAG TPA: DsrE family protein [Thermoplasmataceae archaeon]|nr:DsrE family protein [Thermoplasmataceae archaeon]
MRHWEMMAKALFLIMSGKESPERANIGIMSAARSAEAKRYEDLKVIFFGPSEEYIANLSGQPLEFLRKLQAMNLVDSACVGVAERYGMKDKLVSLGFQLAPAGERIAYYVNKGYEVISF